MDTYAIRADYDERSIIVYQAYREEIALSALARQHFVPPFSLNRMTWIKPSFLWIMERSNWGLFSIGQKARRSDTIWAGRKGKSVVAKRAGVSSEPGDCPAAGDAIEERHQWRSKPNCRQWA